MPRSLSSPFTISDLYVHLPNYVQQIAGVIAQLGLADLVKFGLAWQCCSMNSLHSSAAVCEPQGADEVPCCCCARDLKLDNTLLTNTTPPMIKLCDFGFAKAWENHEDANMHTHIG